MTTESTPVRRARLTDAEVAAGLLDAFQREFDEPSPGAEAFARILGRLLAEGEATILLGGPEEAPVGLAILRLRTSIYDGEQEAHLQELYVAPEHRDKGLGRALLDASMDAARAAGATHIDLNTGETDTDARRLYERNGFTNREGSPDGPSMLYYEREL